MTIDRERIFETMPMSIGDHTKAALLTAAVHLFGEDNLLQSPAEWALFHLNNMSLVEQVQRAQDERWVLDQMPSICTFAEKIALLKVATAESKDIPVTKDQWMAFYFKNGGLVKLMSRILAE